MPRPPTEDFFLFWKESKSDFAYSRQRFYAAVRLLSAGLRCDEISIFPFQWSGVEIKAR